MASGTGYWARSQLRQYDKDNGMSTNYSWSTKQSTKALTTANAFSLFRSLEVDLNSSDVSTARRSRDYLQDQIKRLADTDDSFPRLSGGYKPFGSFARSTKVKPLDDIDMLIFLNGRDSVESSTWGEPYTFQVQITATASPLAKFADSSGYVNSTAILNRFKSGLQSIPNYQKAEIKRNGVAVVLDLKSYSWVFDIVPSLPVSGSGTTTHYLIPNGSGKWMRTDPRRDQDAITEANQRHNGHLIPLIRLIKYWNLYSRAAPRLGSYYLETMLINGLKPYYQPTISADLRSSIPLAFQTLATQVVQSCPDPKGLGGNLDAGISWETKRKVQEAATKRADYATWAIDYERKGDHKNAIMWWGYVFPNFPSYG